MNLYNYQCAVQSTNNTIKRWDKKPIKNIDV